MKQLIECVPNISEGRDEEKIKIISQIVEEIDGVKLLNLDPGKATNRTVITFVGEPQQVIDAAFLLIQKAQELIDMSKHTGEHPRMGATDVCPLVPIANISMEETVKWARKLGERVGRELGIPIYHYEAAAKEEKRKNLANCRSGEYEGLSKKLIDPEWKPDFGPTEFNKSVELINSLNVKILLANSGLSLLARAAPPASAHNKILSNLISVSLLDKRKIIGLILNPSNLRLIERKDC